MNFSAFAKTKISVLSLLVAAVSLLFMSGCEEIPPTLSLQENTDTGAGNGDLETQVRGVLIEEFTGVRCVNCPAGAEAIAQLRVIHGDRLVPVSLHTGFFANPYPESQIDFRTADADAIEAYLGSPQGYPSAVIDRKLFDGEASLQLTRNTWAGYIGLQLSEEPVVAVGVTPSLNDSQDQISVDIELLGRAGTDGRQAFLSVLLLENEVEDVQLTPEGKQDDYHHEHVLRATLTSATGNSIGSVAAGQTSNETFTYDLPSNLDVNKLEVVAYVHYADTDAGGQEILQAVVAKLE